MASTIKLAANLCFLFKDKRLLERFGAAAAAGFKAVELSADMLDDYTVEELVAAQQAAAVEVVGLTAQAGCRTGDRGLAAQVGREEDFRESLRRAIAYAKALNCPKVHTMAGVVTSDPQVVKEAEDIYIRNLKYAAEECAKSNQIVLIEPISTIPNYFLQHQQQAVDILKKVDKPNVKIEFDTYHAQTLDGNLTEFLRQNMSYIGHVQVSQVPGRHEPDAEGEINFPFLFKALVSLGYDGWIGCEYAPRGTTEEGLTWAKTYFR